MADMEKVLKGLEVCTSKPCYCTDCPYKANCCLDSQEVMEDALFLLKEQQEQIDALQGQKLNLTRLLNYSLEKEREQPQIVRCKECKHRYNSIRCPIALIADILKDTKVFEYKVTDDWFCGDGERGTNGMTI